MHACAVTACCVACDVAAVHVERAGITSSAASPYAAAIRSAAARDDAAREGKVATIVCDGVGNEGVFYRGVACGNVVEVEGCTNVDGDNRRCARALEDVIVQAEVDCTVDGEVARNIFV